MTPQIKPPGDQVPFDTREVSDEINNVLEASDADREVSTGGAI